MSDVLIRGMRARALAALERQAQSYGRSLEGELRHILTKAASQVEDESQRRAAFEEAVRAADRMRKKYSGKITGDSADLIRQDRDR